MLTVRIRYALEEPCNRQPGNAVYQCEELTYSQLFSSSMISQSQGPPLKQLSGDREEEEDEAEDQDRVKLGAGVGEGVIRMDVLVGVIIVVVAVVVLSIKVRGSILSIWALS